ncbi:ribonuclease M5 [Hutsoniella sourekii]|uniref:ribonuclease M5 n=1 Tax=Hutsoniella sourekii TaxID=87650 RepID=UPI000489A075|nr:ribonuclease M5 [Hutsoniella sourekii]
MKTPKEWIVVEGPSDTRRLIEVFGQRVKTIETGGSAINQETIDQIRHAHQKQGVIVLTDPDYPGKRIRQLITQAVPSVKHAYIDPQHAQAKRKGKSLGVEHTDDQAILEAIGRVMTPSNSADQALISVSQLMELGLVRSADASQRRKYLADYFHLGHSNGKRLHQQLARYQIGYQEVKQVLEEGGYR